MLQVLTGSLCLTQHKPRIKMSEIILTSRKTQTKIDKQKYNISIFMTILHVIAKSNCPVGKTAYIQKPSLS